MAAIVSKHSDLLAIFASAYMFVQRDNAIGVALFAALLGRFLPRLGPLRAIEAASFFSGSRHSGARAKHASPESMTTERNRMLGVHGFRVRPPSRRALGVRPGMTDSFRRVAQGL